MKDENNNKDYFYFEWSIVEEHYPDEKKEKKEKKNKKSQTLEDKSRTEIDDKGDKTPESSQKQDKK